MHPEPQSGFPRAANPAIEERMHWFAVWTRARHEQVVREQLEHKRVDVEVDAADVRPY
jgi:hypothetical protein